MPFSNFEKIIIIHSIYFITITKIRLNIKIKYINRITNFFFPPKSSNLSWGHLNFFFFIEVFQ